MWAGNARPDGSNAASLQSRWEPPGHQRALQKHSVSDHNKLMDWQFTWNNRDEKVIEDDWCWVKWPDSVTCFILWGAMPGRRASHRLWFLSSLKADPLESTKQKKGFPDLCFCCNSPDCQSAKPFPRRCCENKVAEVTWAITAWSALDHAKIVSSFQAQQGLWDVP